MLENAGAVVDRKIDRIYFPRDLIIEQAANAPAQVMLYSRDGRNDLNLTEDQGSPWNRRGRHQDS